MRRASPALLVLRASDALKVYLPFMLLQSGIAERLPSGLLLPWYGLVVYYTASRFHLVFFDWLTVRYAVSAGGIVHRSGWPTSVTMRAGWSEIGALQVEQDLLHQLLRRFRVRAVLGADARETIELDALDASAVAALRVFHDAGRRHVQGLGSAVLPQASQPSPSADRGSAVGGSSGARLYRAGLRDYLLISVGYGQFVLVVPFLLGAWSDVAGVIGLPDGTVVLDGVLTGGITAAITLVLAAFGFGVLRAWLSFSGYLVTRDASGFEARGGLLRREVRRARREEVHGVRIAQNPLMGLLGRSSVSLVLGSARGEFRSLVVLPVASAQVVRRLLLDLVPDSAEPREPATRVPSAVVAVLVAAGVAAATVAMLAGLGWVAAGAVLATFVALNSVFVRFEAPANGTVLSHRRGLLWRREYVVPVGSLRQIESWQTAGRRSTGRCWGRLVLMDRRPVALWLPGVPSAVVERVAARVLAPDGGRQVLDRKGTVPAVQVPAIQAAGIVAGERQEVNR